MDSHSLDVLDFARIREILASFAQSALGRGLATAIRPATKLPVVKRWLDQVREMLRASESLGLPPFADISDVRDLVLRSAPPLRLKVDEVAAIGRTLQATHAVQQYLAALPEDCTELRGLALRIADYRTLAQRIARVIDERGQVRSEASDKLARIRARVDEATSAIRHVLHRLLHQPGLLRYLQYNNYTFNDDRLVLPVKAEHRGRIPGITHRASDSGATVYIEPAEVVELNNQIASLRADEDEEIGRLLWELVHEVHLNQDGIMRSLDALAVLDLCVAKARFARAFDLHCPDLNDAGRFNLRNARHPLLLDIAHQKRLAGDDPPDVVPSTIRIGDDFDVLIITGPNTGGKTVTLKTAGLICLMVQAGLPAPVDPGSDVCVFNNVLIDVGDEQSMQQSLSTFSAHVKRLLEMLAKANDRTLLLIDELGAGTDPDEGAAIGRAVLDELRRRRSRCIVTTHLGALKAYAFQRDRVENASVEFDVQSLRPTYKLLIGQPGESNAIQIAERLGMPRRLTDAARRSLAHRGGALRAAIHGTLESKRRAEQARESAEIARLAAADAAERAEHVRAALERRKSEFDHWLSHVVHLRPGDAVRVRNFDRDGRVVRLRLDQQRAEIDIGAFAVEVPIGDLMPPEAPPPPPRTVFPRADGAGVGSPLGSTTHAARHDAASRTPRSRGNGPPHGNGPRRDHERPRQNAPPSSVVGPRSDPAGSGDPAGAPHAQDHRRSHGSNCADGHDSRREHARPALASLTDEQASALKPGDPIYAKRFHRAGKVVRVNPARRVAIVSVGALELEVPFNGLAFAAT